MFLSQKILSFFFFFLTTLSVTAQINAKYNNHYMLESTSDAAQLVRGAYGLGGNISSIAYSNKYELIGGVKNIFSGSDGILYFYLGGSTRIGQDGGLGIHISSIGNSSYHEYRAQLAYAHQLGEKTSLGLSINGISVGADHYETEQSMTFSLGFQTQIYKNLLVGSQLYGLYYIGFWDRSDAYAEISIHALYSISEDLQAHANISKLWHQGTSVSAGLSYRINDYLFINAGFKVNPTIVSFGVGIPFGKFQFDVASKYVSSFGIAPSAHFAYNTQAIK